MQTAGEGITYRWQYQKPGGAWANSGAEGSDTPALTFKAIASRNGFQYRCVITNAAGAKLYSEPATLWISGMEPAYMPGDVTGDGAVAAEDARLALRAAVGLESYAAGSREFLAADATKDGAITAEDARLILRAAVGLESI